MEREDDTETDRYRMLDDQMNPWPITPPGSPPSMAGGRLHTKFELAYDTETKVLSVTERIKIMPMDLVKADARGVPILIDGNLQSVPFHHDKHALGVANGVGSPIAGGFVMVHRDSTGPHFNVSARKRQVESVLNAHKSVLILDGCSRGASCGNRVKVEFRIEFLVSIRNAAVGNGEKIHKEIMLFPQAERANSSSWGEENGEVKNGAFTPSTEGSVVAHECGHLFNWPDEYWEFGGWVNRRYIKNGELDFQAGRQANGKIQWQIKSDPNLMGNGAWAVAGNVRPYYLDYVAKHFSAMTGAGWRIGYEA